jgi:hypothetical protein
VPAHGLAPQNLSSDKHVDVCAESEEDRGSTPLASSPEGFRGCRASAHRTEGDYLLLIAFPDLSHSLQSCGRPFGLARA